MSRSLITALIAAALAIPCLVQARSLEEAQAVVRDSLRDPESARFRNVAANPNGSVCGEVNARNGYGGYNGFTAFAVDPAGSVWLLPNRPLPSDGYRIRAICTAPADEARGTAMARICAEERARSSPREIINDCWRLYAPRDVADRVARELGVLRTAPAGQPRSSSPTTPGSGRPQSTSGLTGAERAGLGDRIGECWSIDAGAPNIRDVEVDLRVEIDRAGTVRVVRPNGAMPTEPRARMVYEAARRALLDPRCNPLPLPPARLQALNETIFTFRPADFGLR